MTKKDYQLIADAIKASRTALGFSHVIDSMASNIADRLAKDNVRFDRARFLKACE